VTDAVGAQFAATATIDELLQAEAAAGRRDRFTELENLAAAVMAASFAGKPPVKVTSDEDGTAVRLRNIPTTAARTVSAAFELSVQENNGAWWLPESTLLKPGTVNIPAYYLATPRWAMNVAATESGRVRLPGSPDALACWALLVPFADALTTPLMLRGPQSGVLDAAVREAAWAAVDHAYADLGLEVKPVTSALDVMRPGNGWSRLSSAAQRDAKVALVTALRLAVTRDTIIRWRALQLRGLIDRYYAKAKKERPRAQAVLTKVLQQVVAAWFSGSWLSVLDYLGEQPAAGEEITTALPEPRLYVQGSAKVQQIAAEKKLPIDEVAQMLASYLGSDGIRSPIERRVELLHDFWRIFDDAHAEQKPGMRPLTSLVGEPWLAAGEHVPFLTPAYERMLPTQMLLDIDQLWGGECVPHHPERIVSSLFPYAQMAAAFGPALAFWHNVAVTAWHICEGPRAGTDLKGMAEYYSADVAALAAAGAPVDRELFSELKAAERRLGRPREIIADRTVHEVTGFSFETSLSAGARRDGFELLRDIITRHRRCWADTYVDLTIRTAWQNGLTNLAREVNRVLAGRGRLPTVKQFARIGAPVANDWFGGDLAALYVAVGEKPPMPQQRVHLLPYDRAAFCTQLFTALGGRYVPNSLAGQDDGFIESWELRRVVHQAPRFIQLEELLDRPPNAHEFGADRPSWPGHVDFNQYAATVVNLRKTLPIERPPASTPEGVAKSAIPTAPIAGHRAPPPTRPTRTPHRKRREGLLRRLFGRKQ
jgi:hypothetical protein